MNNLNTSDQEISAAQSLLALRHSKPANEYLLTSAFQQLASPPLTQSLNSNKPSPSSTYSTPIDTDTSDRLVQGINTMTTHDHTPTSSLGSSPNLLYYNSQSQFVDQTRKAHQTQYTHQQTQLAHHQTQLIRQSHQNQCFRQPQNQITQITQQLQQPQHQEHILPSIQEMMAGLPISSRPKCTPNVMATHYYSGGLTRYSRAPPHHPYSRKYTTVSLDKLEKHNSSILEARKKIEQHQQHQQRQLIENQLKQQHMLYHSQQLETKLLLQSHKNHRLLVNLQNHSEAELQSFFQSLRQYYRDEYEKEQQDEKAVKEEAQRQQDNNETDDDDESSDYQPIHNTHSSSTSNNIIASKKINNNSKRSNGGVDKPRWTAQEKAELFEAIVKHKSLDIMATFDWGVIGADIGRVDKACKDQWRRGILKMFRDFIRNL